MKLSPGDLKVTRPATKVDEQEKERIEEAINVTSAKMYDKAMELDTQHSVEYIEAAELAALAALGLPTWQHAKVLKESLRQGQALGTATVSQPAALDSNTALQGQPDPAGPQDPHEIQVRDQLLKSVAEAANGLINDRSPILDQFNADWPRIKNRLANSDPGGFVPIADLEAANAATQAVKDELQRYKDSVQRAGGKEIVIGGDTYVKRTSVTADGNEMVIDGSTFVKLSVVKASIPVQNVSKTTVKTWLDSLKKETEKGKAINVTGVRSKALGNIPADGTVLPKAAVEAINTILTRMEEAAKLPQPSSN